MVKYYFYRTPVYYQVRGYRTIISRYPFPDPDNYPCKKSKKDKNLTIYESSFYLDLICQEEEYKKILQTYLDMFENLKKYNGIRDKTISYISSMYFDNKVHLGDFVPFDFYCRYFYYYIKSPMKIDILNDWTIDCCERTLTTKQFCEMFNQENIIKLLEEESKK